MKSIHPAMMPLQYPAMSTMQPATGMSTTAGMPTTGYHPGYPYYPGQTMMPQGQAQYMMGPNTANVLAQQFPAIQQHPIQQATTPTSQAQIPAPIQAMAAPFQPGIAPPPLTPQGPPSSQTVQQGQTSVAQTQATLGPGVPTTTTTSTAATPSIGRPASAVESERPQSAHGGPPIDPSLYMDDQYDHRCSLCIAAWGFAFLSGLAGSAGLLFLQKGLFAPTFKPLGYVLIAVAITFALSMFLFLPASRKYSNKIPVHRQCLPFLLVLLTSVEVAWVIYLIAQTRTEAKGLLAALVAFLGVFWCSLWKIMCLRCCCHRRRISKQKKAIKMETKRRKRLGSDPDEGHFEDFHHVNTQVRETLRNRFNESILQQTIIQSAAPTIAIGSDTTTLPSFVTLQQPSAPPADTPNTSAAGGPASTTSGPNTGTLTTFTSSQAGSSQTTVPTSSQQATSQISDPPPYDAVYRRTPPPPYSTLV